MSQLVIGGVGDSQCWRDVLDGIREITAVQGVKEIAYGCDIAPSMVSNANAERERTEWKAKHLPYFIRNDPSGRIVRALATHGGLDVTPARQMTPEEKLARYEEAISKLPTEMSRGIREMAFGKGVR
jgi:hypothetical protein